MQMTPKLVEITSLDGIGYAVFVVFAVIALILLSLWWLWKESTRLP